ncbi:plasmid stability protein [Treponema primitia ZAS-2]|uniref:Plasmid stability protein n=1 Tax=Treponema primitia (strain ATCC BAA-887 / DSM 12427 / ZAS-2) TaxID=545694 RepID=F5YGU5_TREPZ|nr:type II toxin-antitoxin system VapC family toxin [Treponema primitia]AEF86519.1 plasmid stability protein [Treponema primitia ZAS-2]
MKYLLDTNVLSEMKKSNPNPRVKAFIETIPEDDILISVISVGEIFFGIERLPEGNKKADLSLWFHHEILGVNENHILPLDTEVMLEWARLRAKAKQTLSPNNSLIAATILTHRLTLVTRNTRDFDAVEGLNLINPWD